MAQLKDAQISLLSTTKLFGATGGVPGEIFPGFLGNHNFCHIQHQVVVLSGGGTFTSGAWRTRPLNTMIVNHITGAGLASNQLTLPAGTYFSAAVCLVYRVNTHVSRLFNITASAVLLPGMVGVAGASDATQDSSTLSGTFTLLTTSTLELQHICQTTMDTYGFGAEGGLDFTQGYNIFADLKVWKLE